MKRIIIVDDHASIRTMLMGFLRIEKDYEIIGMTGNGADALTACEINKPDLVILDLILPGLSGAEVIHRVRGMNSGIRVLVYSGASNPFLIRRCLQADPDAYVEKLAEIDALREGLKAVFQGRKYFTELPASLLRRTEYEGQKLTDRETEVLQLIAEGNSNKQVAQRLRLSSKTVECHRTSLMNKLNAHNSADITRHAMRIGLVE